MKLYHRILIAPALAVFLLLISGGLSYQALHSQNRTIDELFTTRQGNQRVAYEMEGGVLATHSKVYRLLTWGTSMGEAYIEKEARALLPAFDRQVADFKQWSENPALLDEEKKLGKLVLEQSAKYKKSMSGALDLASVDINTAVSAMQTADDDFKQLDATLTRLIEFQVNTGKEAYNRAGSDYERSKYLQLATLLVAIVFAAALSVAMARRILKQLGGEPDTAMEVAGSIADGDLSYAVDLAPGDDSSVLHSMRQMQLGLKSTVAEIQQIVDAALVGDFSRKIDLSGKRGFSRDIGHSLNQLSDITQTGFGDVLRVADALANGDLTQKIVKDYPGIFGQAKDALNGTVEALGKIVAEIQHIVDAAAVHGDFSIKLDLADKHGYSKTLSELLNQLSDITDTGLKDVCRVAEALSHGDLTQTIERNYPGLFGQTKEAVNDTVDRLKHLVLQIKNAVAPLDTAAKEIAAGNIDLSQRTEEQASSLEETAGSIEELTDTVKQNAENATKANLLARSASDIAKHGGDVVGKVVTTMSGINHASHRIVDIISVIDSISFQTNILALNAAVEAARAGEQGRGFAVVATEVRSLAQRSAEAAREIKGLIDDSVNRVADGAQQVKEAGTTMSEIVDAIQRVAEIIGEISKASNEQSDGIGQVNLAISQMDRVTQQNAALVEEAAAAAESMQEQAENLAKSVAVFTLDARPRSTPLPAQLGHRR